MLTHNNTVHMYHTQSTETYTNTLPEVYEGVPTIGRTQTNTVQMYQTEKIEYFINIF